MKTYRFIYLIATLIFLGFSSPILAESTGYLTIKNVRTYQTGFVVKVQELVNQDCGYPSTLMLYKNTDSNYRASISLFLSAWMAGKKLRAYYSGCGENGADSTGNVRVTGWLVN